MCVAERASGVPVGVTSDLPHVIQLTLSEKEGEVLKVLATQGAGVMGLLVERTSAESVAGALASGWYIQHTPAYTEAFNSLADKLNILPKILR